MKRKVLSAMALTVGLSFVAGISPVIAEETTVLEEVKERVAIHGAIEVDLTVSEDFEGESTSDIELATADFSFETALTDWATGVMALTWNGDDDKIEVDEAFITLANPEKTPISLQAGRFVVPFGAYEGSCLSDPLTKEAFEAKEDSVMVAFEANGLYAKAYVFNGDTNEGGGDDSIEHFGVNVGYAYESDDLSLNVGLGYINSLADADGITDFLSDAEAAAGEEGMVYDANTSFLNADYVNGMAANAILTTGPVTLICEYVTALDDYESAGSSAEWKAWQVEADYTFNIMEKETVFALGYSATDEMGGIMPESRIAGTVNVGLGEGISVAAEYCHDEDYDKAEGGTGDSAELVTVRLAYEF